MSISELFSGKVPRFEAIKFALDPTLREAPILVTVVAALVEERGGDAGEPRVFLARRSEAAGHGGLWELPGGKVEHGESPEAALQREIREELGIGLDIVGPPSRSRSRIGDRDFEFIVFPARFLGGRMVLAAHDDWMYFSAAQLNELELAPLDGPILHDWSLRRNGAARS